MVRSSLATASASVRPPTGTPPTEMPFARRLEARWSATASDAPAARSTQTRTAVRIRGARFIQLQWSAEGESLHLDQPAHAIVQLHRQFFARTGGTPAG